MTITTATVREAAVVSLVDSMRRERAGQDTDSHYRQVVQPALNAARAAGYSGADIHGEADRQYGQWLIDNSRPDAAA